jgi:hypothetical protein
LQIKNITSLRGLVVFGERCFSGCASTRGETTGEILKEECHEIEHKGQGGRNVS